MVSEATFGFVRLWYCACLLVGVYGVNEHALGLDGLSPQRHDVPMCVKSYCRTCNAKQGFNEPCI